MMTEKSSPASSGAVSNVERIEAAIRALAGIIQARPDGNTLLPLYQRLRTELATAQSTADLMSEIADIATSGRVS